MARKIGICAASMSAFSALMTGGACLSYYLIPEFYGLLIGGIGLILLFIAQIALRKHVAVMAAVIAAAGALAGLAFGTFFNYAPVEFDAINLLIAAGGALAVYALFILYSLSGWMWDHPVWGTLAAVAVVLGALIPLAAVFGHPALICGLFYFIPLLLFMIALMIYSDNLNDDIQLASYCSLGALFFVALVVLTVLSDGDAAEGFIGMSFDSRGKKPKK